LDGTIYGIMLILFIIFLPRGILGSGWAQPLEILRFSKDKPG